MSADFFKSFFERHAVIAPQKVLNTFLKKFPLARNIEWYENNNNYESIFYNNEIEIIAKFKPDGTWLETGVNLDVSQIPHIIRKTAEKFGEVMNSIEFESIDSKKFELIVRNTELTRYLLVLNEKGDVLKYEPWEKPVMNK